MNIKINIGTLTFDAELHDTPTGEMVFDVLPLNTSFDTWGDEIYFSIPVAAELDETASEEVFMGDLGYWPTGKAFCIFFGPTPMSTLGKIVPASAVNVIGKVHGDALRLKEVMHETQVMVEKA
ncbi:MAG: hypothetical protein HN366_05800 [Deltaproteobacteria bacterium]|jgi:hypothetical protein|nr:hypothetical protein [Deltaproteobacteria bacterium]